MREIKREREGDGERGRKRERESVTEREGKRKAREGGRESERGRKGEGRKKGGGGGRNTKLNLGFNPFPSSTSAMLGEIYVKKWSTINLGRHIRCHKNSMYIDIIILK